MGVDLRLMPLLGPDFWVAHDHIDLERRRELWPAIDAIPAKEIPKPLGCFIATDEDGDSCYGDVEESPYGERLKWTTASDLLSLKDNQAVQDNWRNQAAWAYLAQMPPDYPIVLYWH